MLANPLDEFIKTVHLISVSEEPLKKRARSLTSALQFVHENDLPEELEDEFRAIKEATSSDTLDGQSPHNLISRIVSLSYRLCGSN